MIITFYDVDFDENHVIYFSTKEKQDAYFTTTQIAKYTNARKFLDEYTNTVRVKFSPGLKNANYVKITIFENNANEVTTYYYITRSRIITDETIEFSIEKDVWQSEVATNNVSGEIGVNITSDSDIIQNVNIGCLPVILPKMAKTDLPSVRKIQNTNGEYMVAVIISSQAVAGVSSAAQNVYYVTTLDPVATESTGRKPVKFDTIEEAEFVATDISRSTTYHDGVFNTDVNYTTMKAYVLPYYDEIEFSAITNKVYVKGNNSFHYFIRYTYDIDIIKTSRVSSSATQISEFGTLSARIPLKYDKNEVEFFTRFISNGASLAVLIGANGRISDVTSSFETPLAYSAAAQYYAQNEMQRMVQYSGSVISIGHSAGNQSAGGIISGIVGIANNIAAEIDLQNRPDEIKGYFNNVANLVITGGFGVFTWTAINKNEIEYAIEKYGYNVSTQKITDIFTRSHTNAEYYYKCDYANFDKADREVRNYLENLFGAGVWIKWNT